MYNVCEKLFIATTIASQFNTQTVHKLICMEQFELTKSIISQSLYSKYVKPAHENPENYKNVYHQFAHDKFPIVVCTIQSRITA